MKALSIRQPWAWAILHAGKRVENRTWVSAYRGPILLHASSLMTMKEYDAAVRFMRRIPGAPPVPAPEELLRWGIVGYARIADWLGRDRAGCSHPRAHDAWRFDGQNAIVLEDVAAVPFVPSLGRTWLYRVAEETAAAIAKALR